MYFYAMFMSETNILLSFMFYTKLAPCSNNSLRICELCLEERLCDGHTENTKDTT